MRKIENRKIKDESEKLRKLPTAQTGMSSIAQASKPQNHGGNKIRASSAPDGRGRQGEAPPVVDYNSVTPERWQSGRMRRFAKPLYGLTPVPRVRIPPSPPVGYALRILASTCKFGLVSEATPGRWRNTSGSAQNTRKMHWSLLL